jgi:hypothetical protein
VTAYVKAGTAKVSGSLRYPSLAGHETTSQVLSAIIKGRLEGDGLLVIQLFFFGVIPADLIYNEESQHPVEEVVSSGVDGCARWYETSGRCRLCKPAARPLQELKR